jgi:periplasmic divalent cation tolerance protein
MRVVLCTCPPADAERIARHLLAQGASCVNVLPAVRSLYVWKGEVCDDAEALLVVKAAAERVEALCASLVGVHPYELPEWVVLDADPLTSPEYRAWVRDAAERAEGPPNG